MLHAPTMMELQIFSVLRRSVHFPRLEGAVGRLPHNQYGAPNHAMPPVARRGLAPRALNEAGRSRRGGWRSDTTAHSPRTRCRALYNACVGSTALHWGVAT